MLFDYFLLLTQRTQAMVHQTYDSLLLQAQLTAAFGSEKFICMRCGYGIYWDQQYSCENGKHYHTPDTQCATNHGYPPILHEQNS
jgi:hypothetical protein